MTVQELIEALSRVKNKQREVSLLGKDEVKIEHVYDQESSDVVCLLVKNPSNGS